MPYNLFRLIFSKLQLVAHLLVSIDAELRHIPENVDEITAGSQWVCFYVIGEFIGIGRNQFTAGRDGHGVPECPATSCPANP